MTAYENSCVCSFPKIITSRYPSRTLRVAFATAEFSTKLDIGRFLSLWKRQ